MSDSQDSDHEEAGKTHLELNSAESSIPADAMATFVLPGIDSKGIDSNSRPGDTSVLETNPGATLAMEGGTQGAPPGDGTFILPPASNVERTLLGEVGQTLPDGALPGGPDGVQIAIKGYKILGELGRGGMGVVYKARQAGLNRIVALKMIIAGGHAAPEQLARFRAEAEAVAQLQHPNIVQVYDIGEQDGLPYFSLEFVDGKPLDKELDGKPQPEQKAAQMMETLARAMHYAHERGIIHRDLKPANVLQTKTGVLKISDFGLAKQLENDSSQTKTGTIMGTPSYMAPEQGRGEKQIGHPADVYALGSMLYEMIVGRPPFLAPTALKTLMRLLNEEPVPPSRVQPGVSRDLETICIKCLQKDPARRYETAGALAEDLRRFQAGEAIEARRVGRPERAWRWCKRNPRTAVLSGAVAVLVLTVGMTLSLMGLRMARDRAAVAETRKQAEQRFEQATLAAAAGGMGRAQDLLRWSDPLLTSTADLADIRGKLEQLRTQVTTYDQFRKLLDQVRYLGLFGATNTLDKAQKASHELIGLYDQIEQRQGVGLHGWPPLNPSRKEQLQEDIFEAFLVSSQIERNAAQATGDQAKLTAATRLSIDWLNRAEKILPPTKALFVWRGGYYETLGDKTASKADFDRAAKIEATSAVDRFWHAFADYRRAEDALQKGDGKAAGNFFRLAATGFAKVIEVRPENFWAHFSWATCLPRLGDGYGALVGFTACTQINADVPWPYNNRGTIHFQLREFDQALADFEHAIAVSPEDVTGYVRRGTYYYVMKDFSKAKENFGVALKLQPNDMEARRSRAVVSLLSKDLDGSFADWKEMGNLLPKSHEPNYYRGVILLGRNQYEPALAELAIALQKKPNDAQSLLARAMIYRWQGKTEEALADINLVVNKLIPNRHDYIIERADLLRALGRDAEALEDYQRCLALQSKQTDAYVGMAQVHEKQGNLMLARESYDKMVKADPAAASAYLLRAEFLRSHGEFDAAVADCDQATKIEPKSVLPGLVRAGITAARGDPTQAVSATEKLLEGAPQNDGKVLYAAACVWSLAAQAAQKQTADPKAAALAQAYSERAAKFLADVVGSCFHDLQYPQHNRLAWDPALETVRKLPQVEKLITGRK